MKNRWDLGYGMLRLVATLPVRTACPDQACANVTARFGEDRNDARMYF